MEYETYMNRGRALYEAREYKQATQAFEQAIPRAPKEKTHLVYSNLAGCYLQIPGKDKEAFECAKKSIEAEPTFVKAWLRMGEAAFRLRDGKQCNIVLTEISKWIGDSKAFPETLLPTFVYFMGKCSIRQWKGLLPGEEDGLYASLDRFLQARKPTKDEIEFYVKLFAQIPPLLQGFRDLGMDTYQSVHEDKLFRQLDMIRYTEMACDVIHPDTCLEGFIGRAKLFKERKNTLAETLTLHTIRSLRSSVGSFHEYGTLRRGYQVIQRMADCRPPNEFASRTRVVKDLSKGEGGRTLVAAQAIPAGEIVCYYPVDFIKNGTKSTRSNFEALNESVEAHPSYLIAYKNILYPFVDQQGYPRGPLSDNYESPFIGHLINDCMEVKTLADLPEYFDRASKQANVASTGFLLRPGGQRECVAILAARDIQPEEEICMFYSPYSWGLDSDTVQAAWKTYQENRPPSSISLVVREQMNYRQSHFDVA
jgi:tetratricopeptide (TPR) repeat protein